MSQTVKSNKGTVLLLHRINGIMSGKKREAKLCRGTQGNLAEQVSII
jgi:hypothetical protein